MFFISKNSAYQRNETNRWYKIKVHDEDGTSIDGKEPFPKWDKNPRPLYFNHISCMAYFSMISIK